MIFSMSPIAPDTLVSRTGSAVPRSASARSSSTVRLNLVLAHGIPPAFSDGVHFKVVVVVVFLTLTDPLRIQPWSQDRRNQTKSNRESEISRESRHKRTDKRVASKGHRRDKIENTNKNTQTVETN